MDQQPAAQYCRTSRFSAEKLKKTNTVKVGFAKGMPFCCSSGKLSTMEVEVQRGGTLMHALVCCCRGAISFCSEQRPPR
jgi:hypothetical protein